MRSRQHEHVLDVPFHHQETGYYCGPATIQMILEYLRIGELSQDMLWQEVQDISACKTHLERAEPVRPLRPQEYLWVSPCPCWATSPEAATAVIDLHVPGTVRLSYPDRAPEGIASLVASIDADIPSAATILGVTHWVVVSGYLLDSHSPPSDPPNPVPYAIQGLYVMDPMRTDAILRRRLIHLQDWTDNYFGLMDCGPYQDRYPVVAGGR